MVHAFIFILFYFVVVVHILNSVINSGRSDIIEKKPQYSSTFFNYLVFHHLIIKFKDTSK